MPAKPKKKPLRPIDISIPYDVVFENDSVLVRLATLDELEAFWEANRGRFPFAAGGFDVGEHQTYLRPDEWVFGSSKASVFETLMRWGHTETGIEFYDWAHDEPEKHKGFFVDRDLWRSDQQEAGVWSDAQEAEYQADCVERTHQTYWGWWQFKNLPGGCSAYDWLALASKREELWDPNMDPNEAARRLHEQTFDDWMLSGVDEIKPVDVVSMEKTIRHWRQAQESGQGYYGRSDEPAQAQ